MYLLLLFLSTVVFSPDIFALDRKCNDSMRLIWQSEANTSLPSLWEATVASEGSAESCKEICLNQTTFNCSAFDWFQNDITCHLASENIYFVSDSSLVETNESSTHYWWHCHEVCGANETVTWTIYNDSSHGLSFRDELHPVDTLEECQYLCLYHDGCNVAGYELSAETCHLGYWEFDGIDVISVGHQLAVWNCTDVSTLVTRMETTELTTEPTTEQTTMFTTEETTLRQTTEEATTEHVTSEETSTTEVTSELATDATSSSSTTLIPPAVTTLSATQTAAAATTLPATTGTATATAAAPTGTVISAATTGTTPAGVTNTITGTTPSTTPLPSTEVASNVTSQSLTDPETTLSTGAPTTSMEESTPTVVMTSQSTESITTDNTTESMENTTYSNFTMDYENTTVVNMTDSTSNETFTFSTSSETFSTDLSFSVTTERPLLTTRLTVPTRRPAAPTTTFNPRRYWTTLSPTTQEIFNITNSTMEDNTTTSATITTAGTTQEDITTVSSSTTVRTTIPTPSTKPSTTRRRTTPSTTPKLSTTEQPYNTTAEKEEIGMKVISKQGSSSCDDLEDFQRFNRKVREVLVTLYVTDTQDIFQLSQLSAISSFKAADGIFLRFWVLPCNYSSCFHVEQIIDKLRDSVEKGSTVVVYDTCEYIFKRDSFTRDPDSVKIVQMFPPPSASTRNNSWELTVYIVIGLVLFISLIVIITCLICCFVVKPNQRRGKERIRGIKVSPAATGYVATQQMELGSTSSLRRLYDDDVDEGLGGELIYIDPQDTSIWLPTKRVPYTSIVAAYHK